MCELRVPGLDDVPDMVSFKDPRSLGPRRLETWIVLELCGLGSLQVRQKKLHGQDASASEGRRACDATRRDVWQTVPALPVGQTRWPKRGRRAATPGTELAVTS